MTKCKQKLRWIFFCCLYLLAPLNVSSFTTCPEEKTMFYNCSIVNYSGTFEC